VTVVINAFISFRHKRPANEIAEGMRLFPTECDYQLSALEPFRACQAFRVRVYDLGTTSGRLRGLLNGVVESPAIIVAGEKHIGLVAVNDALDRIAGNVMIGRAVA
jgi:hypothetical protein